MVRIKNIATGLYVKFLTGEEIGYTDSRIDAFDYDDHPGEEVATWWLTNLAAVDPNAQFQWETA